MRLFKAWAAAVFRYEGQLISMAAARGGLPGSADAVMAHLQVPHAPTQERPEGRTALTRTIQHVVDVDNDMSWSPRYRDDARARGFRSYVAVPMLRGDVVVGVITVSRQQVGGFAPVEISLLQTFADQAVIAIENVRLFNETNRALERLTATSEILRVVATSPTDLQPVLDALVVSAGRLCQAADTFLLLVERDLLRTVAGHGPGYLGNPGLSYSINRAWVAGRAIMDKQAIHVEDLVGAEAEFPLGVEIATRFGHRTALALPLLRQGVAIGALFLRRQEVRKFSDKEIALLQTFADQAVIAIENVRLFKELQEKNRALTQAHARVTEALDQQIATADILKVISQSPTDVQPVFDTIVSSAVKLCGGHFSVLFRLDGELMHLVAAHNWGHVGLEEARRMFPARPSRASVAGRAILERSVVNIPDLELDPEYQPALARAVGIRNGLGVPMLRGGTAIGAIAVGRAEAGPFSDDPVALLQTFAEQAVIAIENVRLFNETKEALERQTATSEILRVIASSPNDVQPVFDAIAKSGTTLCDAAWGAVIRFDGQLLTLMAQHNMTPSELELLSRTYPRTPTRGRATGRAIIDRRTIHVADIREDPDYLSPFQQALGFRTVLAVPMLRDGEPIGVLALWRREVRQFTDQQIELVETFADQAVIAIENVRLFKELQQKNRALTEALEQQTATSEILQTIAQAQSDVQPGFDTIVSSAAQLCNAHTTAVFLADGQLVYLPASYGDDPGALATIAAQFPRPLDGQTAAGKAILTRSVVHMPDVEEPSAMEFARQTGRAIGFQIGRASCRE